MLHARLDSLFVRLLLAQLVLVLSSMAIFGALVIIERNTLQMPQFAELWAPAFQAATTQLADESAPIYGLPGGIRRRPGPPTGPRLEISSLPAATLLRDGLTRRGVVVAGMWLVVGDGGLVFWTQVVPPGRPGVWLSGQVPSVLPRWTMRTTVTFLLLLAVVALVSRNFARHVTRPLDGLRQRMQNHAHGSADGAAAPVAMTASAPPELLAMDAAFHQLAQRLQRNERERALLLAGVSHDLRSPLARIRLAAEMLPESSDNRGGVAAITRNVDHADQLIASFMEFVRASAPDLEPAGTVDLVATTRQAVSRFERMRHDLVLQAPATLLLHRVPALLLDRLVANLVDNAFKHGAPPVVVQLRAAGDAAVLTVGDAGPGLPQGSGAGLLEAFARGDASRAVPGVGLGLAIAQQIVQRLGGDLSFERDASGHHQVRVQLPLTR